MHGGGEGSVQGALSALGLEQEVLAVKYDPARRVIITAGNDHVIRVWSPSGYYLLGVHLGWSRVAGHEELKLHDCNRFCSCLAVLVYMLEQPCQLHFLACLLVNMKTSTCLLVMAMRRPHGRGSLPSAGCEPAFLRLGGLHHQSLGHHAILSPGECSAGQCSQQLRCQRRWVGHRACMYRTGPNVFVRLKICEAQIEFQEVILMFVSDLGQTHTLLAA